ncbi:MAG: terminase small subunit [Alphaproteobacteria bacterium]
MTSTNLTIKQENFCQTYVETGNASEAYRRAYDAKNMKPEVIAVKACELMKHGKLTVRIEALKASHAERHNVTIDILTEELNATLDLAMKNGNPSAGVSAIMAKAKIHGFLTMDRPNERDPIKDMSDEELDARIAELNEIEGRRRERLRI